MSSGTGQPSRSQNRCFHIQKKWETSRDSSGVLEIDLGQVWMAAPRVMEVSRRGPTRGPRTNSSGQAPHIFTAFYLTVDLKETLKFFTYLDAYIFIITRQGSDTSVVMQMFGPEWGEKHRLRTCCQKHNFYMSKPDLVFVSCVQSPQCPAQNQVQEQISLAAHRVQISHLCSLLWFCGAYKVFKVKTLKVP